MSLAARESIGNADDRRFSGGVERIAAAKIQTGLESDGLFNGIRAADAEGMGRWLFMAVLFTLVSNTACADVRIEERSFGVYPQRLRFASVRDVLAEALLALKEKAPPPGLLLRLPLAGRISSGFGLRRDPLQGESAFHRGIDIAARFGAPVRAAAGGEVIAAGRRGGCGLAVVIGHRDGVATRSCHLAAIAVQPGQRVGAGQVIGWVGMSGRATGPHLHFEVADRGRVVDPAAQIAVE